MTTNKLEIGDIVRVHYKITEDMTIFRNGVVVSSLDNRQKHFSIKTTDVEFETVTSDIVDLNKAEGEKPLYLDVGMDHECTIEILSR